MKEEEEGVLLTGKSEGSVYIREKLVCMSDCEVTETFSAAICSCSTNNSGNLLFIKVETDKRSPPEFKDDNQIIHSICNGAMTAESHITEVSGFYSRLRPDGGPGPGW